MNCITIKSPVITSNRIDYYYEIHGEWKETFNLNEHFYIEYSRDLSSVPESIAVIPLLANILPMAWVYDAEIYVPVCDKAFYDSVDYFKLGYKNMYPSLKFGGKLITRKIEENHPGTEGGTAAFFSGGVDAFNTLVSHADEHPTLFTLWGADVKLNDITGWEKVETHLKETSEEFQVDFVTIKSCFRRFLDEGQINRAVAKSGDNWWHGFQHSIGIISHAAPLAYVMRKETIYFASSFTIDDKGKVTCASDPTIDNYVKFGNTNIVHDGYEFTRQMKIHNIVEYVNKSGRKISLRVCWESIGGLNCCKCEKCWRTILGVYAEGEDPRQYGFEYSESHFKALAKKMRFDDNKMLSELRYGPIQDVMKKNWKIEELPKELRWFYITKRNNLGKHPCIALGRKVWHKTFRLVKNRKKM